MQRILGQSRAIDVLQTALRSSRVHHAWIFAGPRGVGKFTTAIEFARVLLDPGASPNLSGEIEADPDSRTSHLIDAGTHPDLHVVRKELALYSDDSRLRDRKLMNIPLDVLREHMLGGKGDEPGAQAPAYRTAALSHGKVFIIDEAELLATEAQNALLKTLEEPPAETYIVLVTSRPDRLLPTILSRCQFVQFGPLDDEAMAAWLRQSGLEPTTAQRTWIERFAEGSPGFASLAIEYGFPQWQETLAPMLADLDRSRFPTGMGETLASLIDEFAQAWVKNHTNASKDAANKDGMRHMFTILTRHLRDGLAAACDAGDPPRRWIDAIQLIRDAEREIESNVNQKMVLENLVAQWALAGKSGRATATA